MKTWIQPIGIALPVERLEVNTENADWIKDHVANKCLNGQADEVLEPLIAGARLDRDKHVPDIHSRRARTASFYDTLSRATEQLQQPPPNQP